MNGEKYLLDTNAIIALLSGNRKLVHTLKSATWVGTFVNSLIEFLSFSSLDESDIVLFKNFVNRINVLSISSGFDAALSIAELRVKYKLKTPDVIIAHSALEKGLTLVSNDKDIAKLTKISILTF